jgi:hypothetical protein
MLVVKGYGDAADHSRRISQLCLAVAGKINADLMSQRGKGARQGADYVCQPASLGKWNALGSDKRDIHKRGTSRSARTFFRRTL